MQNIAVHAIIAAIHVVIDIIAANIVVAIDAVTIVVVIEVVAITDIGNNNIKRLAFMQVFFICKYL